MQSSRNNGRKLVAKGVSKPIRGVYKETHPWGNEYQSKTFTKFGLMAKPYLSLCKDKGKLIPLETDKHCGG
jgi:hypothetical protein